MASLHLLEIFKDSSAIRINCESKISANFKRIPAFAGMTNANYLCEKNNITKAGTK